MLFGRRNRGQPPTTYEGAQLIADTEAFLSGDYVDYLWRRGMTAPGWAWLNRLAHGDVQGIENEAWTSANESLRWSCSTS